MVRACFLLVAALCCFSFAAVAQTPPEKKTEVGKGKDTKSKDKDVGKTKAEDAKELPKSKIPLEKLKTSPNTLVIVVESMLDAMALFPKLVVMTPEQYQDLKDQIKTLQQQLKIDEVSPHGCRLYGKLEGDSLALRAEFTFKTYQPRTKVFLGLLGAVLTDAGQLDGQQAFPEPFEKRGFFVPIEKEGEHQLTLNLSVKVDVKKVAPSGTERGVDLGLPMAAVQNLELELPANIKEFRANDELEKPKSPGRWSLALGRSKQLKLSWKDPLPQSSNTTSFVADGVVNVHIDEMQVHVKGDLFVEDRRVPVKEWQILLPAQAKAKIYSPTGLEYSLNGPDGNSLYHTFKAPTPSGGERWRIAVSMDLPRPAANIRLPIGSFIVVGAAQQHTINVQMPMEASLGQRILFHTKNATPLKNLDSEASFKYDVRDKNPKPTSLADSPLALEWRYDKNQLETKVNHSLKWTTLTQGWQLDVVSRIDVKTIFAGASAIDLKLPMPRQRGMLVYGTAMPAAAFPAGLPWAALWNPQGVPWADPVAEENAVVDDLGIALNVVSRDPFGKVRVVWGSPTKKLTLVLKSSYRVSSLDRRMRVELPRPLNTQDRGAKLSIQGDDRVEVLYGPSGAEEPVPERHHFDLSLDQAPAKLDLAWRPHHREITAESTVDVLLHEHTAEVRQAISFPWDASTGTGADPRQTQIRLIVPRGVERVKKISGGEISSEDLAKQEIWFRPTADAKEKVEIVLQYDVAIGKRGAQAKKTPPVGAPTLSVPMIWPASVSRKDVKVRIWSQAGGVKVRLSNELLSRGVWKERSIEAVKGKDSFPVMVLQAVGASMPLTLTIEDTASFSSSAFVADRGLIQMVVNENGSQQYRARFRINKIYTDHIDVEMPLPMGRFRDRPIFLFAGDRLTDWETVDADKKTIRLKLSSGVTVLPGILEIQYVIPTTESGSSWRTILEAPSFRSDGEIDDLRWQLSLPMPMIAVTFGKQVRTRSQWTVQGWLLTPEPTTSSLEQWLTGKEANPSSVPVTFEFSQGSLQPLTIYHFPRQGWLLGCSGVFLVFTLGVYFSPLPRFVFSLLLMALAVSLLSVGIVWPGTLDPLLFGCQPGVVVLAIFVAIHWAWQERSRRQLVFLPAFSRAKPASTVTMPSAAKRPREPSTVDAPAPPGNGPAPSSSGSQVGS